MPRRARYCPTNIPVHVIQRGNNRQVCFTCDSDIAAYAHWLAEGARKFSVQIHAWVFMTNHVHLLLTPATDSGTSKLMHYLGLQYVRNFNYKYARSGGLFEGRFRSSIVQSNEYLLTCLRYIELNPVRAGMVKDPGDYHWSSYRCHAFGTRSQMWHRHPQYLDLGDTATKRQNEYRRLIRQKLPAEVIAKVRHCANTGLVLGTEQFREQVEKHRR